ncbi:ABC transporter ATP-binding protein [Undibacterium squillarum]|uniref:Sugar ABC transporter ATP-binding protein n=1 Tax=Undibacterium squillarum TaxID=1131567 RepID=A0ABQ2XZT2_9BURK|nr:ABC transporter ATP-binding protein [Undibacterium squillarum]GGX43850.1 sugar ABC transporter ATP-binding protein [Undibacterium squillarum]
MAALELHQIRKEYDGNVVLNDINLHIENGELLVLLGPSGCGKSTLLRMIAGLDDISSGELRIDGRLANHLPPAKRQLAMVFQSYALYPHMSVFDNMAFSLKMAGNSAAQIREKVHAAAETLQISHLLDRLPKALSGGQRQRVAIGRAIVREPSVFLFDEPLSNLDASLRGQMRVELARLHKKLGATMIYVTHDQVEAMTLGQRIVVLNQGKIEQLGTPAQLYRTPASLFVARFLGMPAINCFSAQLMSSDGPVLRIGGHFLLRSPVVFTSSLNDVLTVAVRPEHMRLTADTDYEMVMFSATVTVTEQLGDCTLLYLQVPWQEECIAVRDAQCQSWQTGQTVGVYFDAEHCLLFDAAGQRIAP